MIERENRMSRPDIDDFVEDSKTPLRCEFHVAQVFQNSILSKIFDALILAIFSALILLSPLPFGSIQPRSIFLIE